MLPFLYYKFDVLLMNILIQLLCLSLTATTSVVMECAFANENVFLFK
jgi:hypothetical protein